MVVKIWSFESHFLVVILLLVHYVSNWTDVMTTTADDTKTMVKHVKSLIFYRYRVPKAIINDKGIHFCNRT